MANAIGEMVVRIVGDNSDFDKKVDASERKYTRFAKTLADTGKKLTTFVTLPLLGIGIAAVKSAADLEMQQAAFETMLGSAKDAQRLLTDLKDMAARTPFQLSDLADASKTLLSFGVAAEDILPTIQQLGDVAQGNGQRFQALSLAFAQVQATGRLMGQDLLQMINAGFNPLQQIAEDTGVSMAELKAQMEKGAISADMVATAFANATGEGGRFAGGMERASETLTGKWSTLMDTLAEAGRSFADVLMPTIKNLIDTLTRWAEKFTALDEGTKRFILGLAAIAVAIGPVILIVGKLIPVILALNAAVAANPLGALALVLGVVTAGVVGYIATTSAAREPTLDLKDAVQELKEEFIALDETGQTTLDALVSGDWSKVKAMEVAAAMAKGQERFAEAQKEIAAGLAQVHQQELLAIATGEEYDAQKARREVILRAINKLIEDGYLVENANIQTLLKLYADLLVVKEEEVAVTDRSVSGYIKKREAIEANVEAEALATEAAKARAVAEAEQAAARLAEWQAETQRVQDYYAFLAELQAADDAARAIAAEKDKARADDVRDRWISAWAGIASAAASLAASLADARIAELEREFEAGDELETKKRKVIHDAAVAAKAFALVQVAIDTARAIIAMLAIGPPGIPLAVVAGITGAIQAAAIAAQPIPPLAQGGIALPSAGGQVVRVAEAGQAEAIIPLDRLNEFMTQWPGAGGGSGEGGMIHLQVQIDGRPILEKIFEATRNRTVLIDAGSVVG